MADIVLLTDFGTTDYYTGQIHGVLSQLCPAVRVIDLCHHLPSFDIQSTAFLLPELLKGFPVDTVFFCVVDPFVGSRQRSLAMYCDQRWLVGPDNGLFSVALQRSRQSDCYEISWRPELLSMTFHGRDLYAPVAAGLATGSPLPMQPLASGQNHGLQQVHDVTALDLWKIIYIDHYGNCLSGIHAAVVSTELLLQVGETVARHAETFSAALSGQLFWYQNSLGLVEFSLWVADAAQRANIAVGDQVQRAAPIVV